MVSADFGIQVVTLTALVLLITLLARGWSKPRPAQQSRDRFLSRLADHGLPQGGPYIPSPPDDFSNSG
jgi:hypothetical protein